MPKSSLKTSFNGFNGSLIRFILFFLIFNFLLPYLYSILDTKELQKVCNLSWISIPKSNFDISKHFSLLLSSFTRNQSYNDIITISLTIFVLSIAMAKSLSSSWSSIQSKLFSNHLLYLSIASPLLIASTIYFSIQQTLHIHKEQEVDKKLEQLQTFEFFEVNAFISLSTSLYYTSLIVILFSILSCIFTHLEWILYFNMLEACLAISSFYSLVLSCIIQVYRLLDAYTIISSLKSFFTSSSSSSSLPMLFISFFNFLSLNTIAFTIALSTLLLYSTTPYILPHIIKDAFEQAKVIEQATVIEQAATTTSLNLKLEQHEQQSESKEKKDGEKNVEKEIGVLLYSLWQTLDSNIAQKSLEASVKKETRLDINAQVEFGLALLQSSSSSTRILSSKKLSSSSSSNKNVSHVSSILDSVIPHPLWWLLITFLRNLFHVVSFCSKGISKKGIKNTSTTTPSTYDNEIRLLATIGHILKQLSYLSNNEIQELSSSFIAILQRISDVAVIRHWVDYKIALDHTHKDTHCLCQRERLLTSMTSTTTTQLESTTRAMSISTSPSSILLQSQQRPRKPLSPLQQGYLQRSGGGSTEEEGMSSPTEALPSSPLRNPFTFSSSSPSSLSTLRTTTAITPTALSSSAMTLSGIDDNGESKLHFAAKNGLIDACKVLLENGSDPNLLNKTGNSAFHIALSKGYEDVILLLLCYGASPTCRNSEGELPDAIADNVGLHSIAASLRAAARVAMRSSSGSGVETISSLQSGVKGVKKVVSSGGKNGIGRDGKR
jgi:hypothetical protein